MKKIVPSLMIVAILIWTVPPLLPISAKQALYAKLTNAEAHALGFEEQQQQLTDVNMVFYTNRVAEDARPALLLLHGYSADKDAWPRFATHLTDHFQIIIPDMAGHGDTGFDPNWSYRAPAQAARLKELLIQLGIKKAHVIGNSMGGFIAAHFALRYPDQTQSAVLIDPAGVASPKPSVMEKMLASGRNPFEIHSREDFDQFFSMTMEKPPWLPSFLLDAAAEQYQKRRAELTHIFADFYAKDMLDTELANINVPVLLLWGAKDQLIHVSSVSIWEAGIPAIQTHIWPDVGHLPMMEVPAESAAVVNQFIASLKDRPASG